jgi:hypothetical protein
LAVVIPFKGGKMRKKIILITSIIVVSLLVFGTVQAGFLFDYGELEGYPGAGEANWMAWWLTDGVGRPAEILTEDNTNSINGEDIGYSDIYDIGTEIEPEDAYLEWILQVENFATKPIPGVLDDVNLLFGGLGTFSGTLWEKTFDWTNTEAFTDNGLVPALTGDYPACPLLYEPLEVTPNTYTFYTEQPGTYLVYRSQNASGAGNDASNGRYFYFDTVTEDEISFGIGSFTDTAPDPKWYIVFQVDENNTPIGCHSEPADPTNVRVLEFTAEYNPIEQAVDLAWVTTSEIDMLGFYILRSESETGVGSKVNEEMILVENPGGTGASYTYTDETVEMGKTYYYWLEVVDTSGRSEFGPRTVRTTYQLYIPLFN